MFKYDLNLLYGMNKGCFHNTALFRKMGPGKILKGNAWNTEAYSRVNLEMS